MLCNASTGANINAGDNTANGVVTSTNGAWSTITNIFTATSGTPFSGVSVGDFASLYADGATVSAYVARVTAIGSGGLTLTLSSTAKSGTAPTTAGIGISCTTGGVWKGPNAAVSFPFGFITAAQTNVAGDVPRVNFKNNATYSITAAMTHSLAGPTQFEGYTTTPGDGGRAIIDGGTSGTSYILLTVSNVQATLRNLIFANNGATGSASGISVSQTNRAYVIGVVVHDVRGAGHDGDAIRIECEAYNCNQSNTASLGGFRCATAINCMAHDNAGSNSLGFTTNAVPGRFIDCIADSNGSHGFGVSGAATDITLTGCDAYNNGGAGLFQQAAISYAKNCNFLKNGTYGVATSGTAPLFLFNCGFGSGTQVNTSGTVQTTTQLIETGRITYPADVTPWVDPANGDFRINLAQAKGVGRGTFVQTQASYAGTVGYPDVGAAQHQDTSGIVPTELFGIESVQIGA